MSELQWVVSSYTIAFAALILTAGALGDRLGAKKIFMMGFALFTAASLVCALAPGSGGSDHGEGRAGCSHARSQFARSPQSRLPGGKGAWPSGRNLVGRGEPSPYPSASTLAGGALIDLVGWRSIFLVNLPIGLAGLWLMWRYADETVQSSNRELDLLGQATGIGALSS